MVAQLTMNLKHILILMSALFLSTCSQTVDLYFYANESWRFNTQIQYDEGLIDLFGQATSIAIGSEFGFPMVIPKASSAMDVMGVFFNLAKTELRKQGINFAWRKAKDTFIINIWGDTLQKFNRLLSGKTEITALGEGKYHLQMDAITLDKLDPSLEEYSELSDALFAYTFTLHAGHIYNSNADEQTETKAIWYNPSQIDVTFAPSLPFNSGVLMAVCGIGLLVTIMFFMNANKKKCPSCGKWVPRKIEYCADCGAPMDSNCGD